MDGLLRKYLWALDAAVIGAVAVLIARAVSTALVTAFFVQAHVARRQATPPPEDPAPSVKSVETILARNIFCSSCPPPDLAADAGHAAEPTGPQKTALPLKLMAIMYAPAAAQVRWTTAVIRDTEAAVAGPYRVGDTIRGATIVRIDQMRLFLNHGGRIESLDLIGPTGELPSGESPPPAVAAVTPAEVPPPAVAVTPSARPRVTGTAKLFSVRGDRVERHPH